MTTARSSESHRSPVASIIHSRGHLSMAWSTSAHLAGPLGTGMVELGTLADGIDSVAYAVDANGQIVGRAKTSSGQYHAFSWTQLGGMVDLGALGGTLSSANAVNASGQIVGQATVTGD